MKKWRFWSVNKNKWSGFASVLFCLCSRPTVRASCVLPTVWPPLAAAAARWHRLSSRWRLKGLKEILPRSWKPPATDWWYLNWMSVRGCEFELSVVFECPLWCHQDEDDEEELVHLSPPPTLSITEEILEFINQSRAREGLAAIPYAVVRHLHCPTTQGINIYY